MDVGSASAGRGTKPPDHRHKVLPLQTDDVEEKEVKIAIESSSDTLVKSPETTGEDQSANVFTVSSSSNKNIYKWLLGVAALALISVLGTLFTGKMDMKTLGISKEADEYEIIEEEQ